MQKHFDLIKELVNHIEDNVAEEINIISLAKSLDISPWHFQRLFKSMVGDSLGGYIRGRRLSRAAQMLLGTPLRIIDIAFQVGFTSHEAFARSFKAQFNYSPKAFRDKKPSILIAQKPLLTEEVFEFVRRGIQHEPVVLQRGELHLVGMEIAMPSPFSAEVGLCEMASIPWQNLFERCAEINHRIPGAFCGLMFSGSGNFTEDTLSYIAGAVVSQVNATPKGMRSYSLPAQQVAMFETYSTIEDDIVKRTVDYVYGYWLPTATYQRGKGHDYLYLENLTDFNNPVCIANYVVPVGADS